MTGAGAGAGFETGAGFEEAAETVLSAGGSETADYTGSAELISELVLSAAEGAAGCDETVLLFAKVLFGVFLQPDTSIAAQRTKAAASILPLIFLTP